MQYTKEHIDFIKAKPDGMSLQELTDAFNQKLTDAFNQKLTDAFNQKFGTNLIVKAMSQRRYQLGLAREKVKFTDEHVAYIKKQSPTLTAKELAGKLNAHFGTTFSSKAIGNKRCNLGISAMPKPGKTLKTRKNETLCWGCATKDCSWAKKFEPVEGWKATKTKLKLTDDVYTPSYIVTKCPEFMTESEDKQAFRKLCARIDDSFYRNQKRSPSELLVSEKYFEIIKSVMRVSAFEEIYCLKVKSNKYVKDWRVVYEKN